MTKYFSNELVLLEPTDKTEALGGKKLADSNGPDWNLTIEADPSGSRKVAIRAIADVLPGISEDATGWKEGQSAKSYLTQDAVARLRPGHEGGYGDNYVVLCRN